VDNEDAVKEDSQTFQTRPMLRSLGIGGAEGMNTKPPVKLIKKEKRKGPGTQAQVELAADPKKWSTSVLSWVNEFQRHRRRESLPPFDSLFKDALTQPSERAVRTKWGIPESKGQTGDVR
jgi:hypothetical protein